MAAPPLTIQPVPYFAAAVLAHARPAVEASKRRRAFSAPEVMEFPDEYFHDWAAALIDTAEPAVADLIQCGTTEDIQAVLGFFCHPVQTWAAHRRAFFNRLHIYASQMEQEGRGEASEAFAYFMRERYMPNYFYIVERRALSVMVPAAAETIRTPSPLTPSSVSTRPLAVIEECSQEIYEEDDDEDDDEDD
jgi:hypothetical protein